jgi:hemolysin III
MSTEHLSHESRAQQARHGDALHDGLAPSLLPSSAPRPLLRGTLHGAVAMLAPAGFVLLLFLADSPRGYVGASIFATSLVLLYTTSATYHLVPWGERPRRVMTRVDHSMIFVLIGGTYTPFCLLVVGDAWGIPMLSVVWTLASLGVLIKVLRPNAPRWLGVGLYLGLGWVGIIAAWPVLNNMAWWGVLLLAAGGACYTMGALVYGRRWPDPSPRFFGYHEVFHGLVVAGSVLHFTLIATEVV